MAIRNIVTEEDGILRKTSREVTSFDDRLCVLLDDMAETLKKDNGVGLASPQVGVLRRVFIVYVGNGVIEMINPMILKTSGRQEKSEGCLSCPGKWGVTIRPKKVRVQYQDRHGKVCALNCEDLLAQAVCHENDHLDGVLFTDHVVRWLDE